MRITTRKLYFIIADEEGRPNKPFVWCELPADFYFKEYNITGVNDEYNEIYLLLSTCNISPVLNNMLCINTIILAMLAKSLSTIKHHASSLKVKLTNKQTPCLTLEIEQVIVGEISFNQDIIISNLVDI